MSTEPPSTWGEWYLGEILIFGKLRQITFSARLCISALFSLYLHLIIIIRHLTFFLNSEKKVTKDETLYLKPVMTPVAWVAGIWLTALDLHLAQREVKTQQNGKKREKELNMPSLHL